MNEGKQPLKWKNRIISSGEIDPESLIANPANFRKHPKKQQDALNGSLDSLGWLQQVIVNKNSGRIIDGHLRVENAISHGEKTIPVQWVDLTEAEEGLALLSLDPIAAMAETNKKQMENILGQIYETRQALIPYLEEIARNNNIDGNGFYDINKETVIDKTESFSDKWGVEADQVWKLGEHLLLCGDSTKAENVERLIVLGGGGYLC